MTNLEPSGAAARTMSEAMQSPSAAPAERETREPQFWAVDEDQEFLTATSPEDAIDEWYCRQEPGCVPPPEMKVYGFAPREIGEKYRANLTARVLEMVGENLDEEFGNPDDSEPDTPAQEAAARAFVDAYITYFTVRTCDRVAERVVPLSPEEFVSEAPR